MNAFDIWTPVHILYGVILALSGFGRPLAYSLTVGTEISEAIFRQPGGVGFLGPESPANIAVDMIATIGAYEVTKAFSNGK